MNIGLSGHQKMPDIAYQFASSRLDEHLRELGSVTGICSLAAGADQLFAEKIINAGGKLHVVIPCKNYESTFDDTGLENYRTLLEQAVDTEVLEHESPSEEAFYDAGKRVVELSDELIAVWDGKKAQGLGGTADIVSYAEERGKPVLVFWPDGVSR